LTAAHTAVLIDGKGHQYHDGHEGTNASWAEARVVNFKPSDHQLVVTSDATEAYKMVTPDVQLVRRTLIFLKPDILLLFDRVKLGTTKPKVEVRFQVFNGDEKGETEIHEKDFMIKRPQASLQGSVFASSPFDIRSGFHQVPKDIGVYPFIEAEAHESSDHHILTVCTAQRTGKPHGNVSCTTNGSSWNIKIDHNGQAKSVTLNVDEDLPAVTIG